MDLLRPHDALLEADKHSGSGRRAFGVSPLQRLFVSRNGDVRPHHHFVQLGQGDRLFSGFGSELGDLVSQFTGSGSEQDIALLLVAFQRPVGETFNEVIAIHLCLQRLQSTRFSGL
jgi:hypothetical protein